MYWSWNGGPREGRGEEALEKDGAILGGGGAGGGWDSIYENDQSDKVLDAELARTLWKYSTEITGAEWPPANQPTSPPPFLKVIDAATKAANAKEEARRMRPQEGMVAGSGEDILAGGTTSAAGKVVASTGKPGRKRAFFRRLLGLRARKEVSVTPSPLGGATDDALVDTVVTAANDIDARVDEVLGGGGLELRQPQQYHKECVTGDEEECNVEQQPPVSRVA